MPCEISQAPYLSVTSPYYFGDVFVPFHHLLISVLFVRFTNGELLFSTHKVNEYFQHHFHDRVSIIVSHYHTNGFPLLPIRLFIRSAHLIIGKGLSFFTCLKLSLVQYGFPFPYLQVYYNIFICFCQAFGQSFLNFLKIFWRWAV